ncbi:MAG: hypothetical protein KF861_12405, partial [Planctomycetaceae bacterium]|nr:hypothetical protein [Planctomycetaceae bacterium]
MTDNARRCIRRSPTPTPLPRTLAVQVRRAACPLTILFTVTGIGSALHAQDDVPPEAVQRLIRQLDSASLSERSAAERRLQEMGPRILPLLSEPAPSAAARDAIGRIRELLEREQAAQSVLPSRVTLKGEAPLHDVIPVIEAQTGNAIRISGLSVAQLNQTLSFHWHETPFWDCMTFLDRQPHLAVRMSPADGVLEIVPEAPEESQPLVRQTSGAFLVLVQAASLRPDFTDETRRLIRVRFDLVAEPRLRPLFVRVHDGDLLLNAPGEQFLAFNPTASRELPADRPGPVSLTADFVASETWAGDTVALSGKVEVELAAGREEVVFRHLDSAERVIRRRGGVTVTLDRATFRAAED